MAATLSATWDATRSRVVLTAAGMNALTASTQILRYDHLPLTDPHPVRGGNFGSGTDGIAYDQEFTPGVLNYYYLTTYNAAGTLLDSANASVVASATAIWLKSVVRPFLNRPVTVTDFSEVVTPARGGMYEVLGRRLPVAITEVRGSRRFELTLTAADADEAEALELFFSFGDVVLLQVPADCAVPRTMYGFVGDVGIERRGKHDTARRYISFQLTEVAAPDVSIVGSTVTWAGVVSAYATWSTVMAAHATWLSLMTSVSTPSDEVVA